jgi:hypothetical protein
MLLKYYTHTLLGVGVYTYTDKKNDPGESSDPQEMLGMIFNQFEKYHWFKDDS